MAEHNELGVTNTPTPGHHWVGIADKVHDLIGPKISARRQDSLAQTLERFERELVPHLVPFLAEHADNPDMPEVVRDLAHTLTEPEHFTESILLGVAIGATLYPIIGALTQPLVQDVENAAWRTKQTRPLSPDLLAAAALKGVWSDLNRKDEAALSGVSADRFDIMVETAGQSIGLEQALLLLRRGQIDAATFTSIVQYSNINPRFYGIPELLKYAPLSVGEVVTANLKGHLDDTAAATAIGHAGIDPAHQPLLKASAGRPPGIEQMLELWNRSEAGIPGFSATETDVEAAVRQSDINDAYLPFIKQLRHYLPPPRSIVPMLRSGGITEQQARQLLSAYGVGEPWQSAFVAEAHHTSSTTVKELSSSQVTRMYEARLIDRPTAESRLAALKYPASDITLLLDFADDARHERLLNATITKVGTKYVAHKLDATGATHLLNQAGVPPAAQHDLFTLWNVQRDANVITPTPAAILGAFRRSEITGKDAHDRLTQLGIAQTDLAIFAADAFPPTRPNQEGVLAVVFGQDAYLADIEAAGIPPAP